MHQILQNAPYKEIYMREDHEVLQSILVFPVNILVVSPVSYEFARVGFILKIAEEERERKGRRRGRGRGRGKEQVELHYPS